MLGFLSWLELIAWIPELPGTCCLDSRAAGIPELLENLCQGILAICGLSWSCLVALVGAFPEPSGVSREPRGPFKKVRTQSTDPPKHFHTFRQSPVAFRTILEPYWGPFGRLPGIIWGFPGFPNPPEAKPKSVNKLCRSAKACSHFLAQPPSHFGPS